MGFVLDMNQLTFLNCTINNDMSQETIMKKVKEQLKGRIEKKGKFTWIRKKLKKIKKLFFLLHKRLLILDILKIIY